MEVTSANVSKEKCAFSVLLMEDWRSRDGRGTKGEIRMYNQVKVKVRIKVMKTTDAQYPCGSSEPTKKL